MTDVPVGPARAVLVLNGPNLGRLGRREPEIYGSTGYDELAALCVAAGRELGLDVSVRQTESEADLLRWLHDAADTARRSSSTPGPGRTRRWPSATPARCSPRR